MKASTLFTNSKEDLYITSQEQLHDGAYLGDGENKADEEVMEDGEELISSPPSPSSPPKCVLHTAKQWFSKTPERALNQAYNAVLTIKSLEDEYFQGGKISTNSADCSDFSNHLMSFVRADFEKELIIAKLRLAEFKASCLVLSIPVSDHLDKLSFLDGVLAKYISQPKPSIGLGSLPPVGKIASSQFNGQPTSAIEDVNDLKTTFFGVPDGSRTHVPGASPQSLMQPLYPRSAIGTATTVGLAFGVGLVIGGVGSWTLLSTENAAANNDNHQKLAEEVHPNRAVAQTNSTHVKLSVSTPETTLPEFSL